VVAKRLQILCEMVPAVTLVAMLSNPDNPVPAAAEVEEARRAAEVLGVRLLVLNASTPSDIDEAFANIAQQQAGALLVGVDGHFRTQRSQIMALASRHRLPAMYAYRESPVDGGLMSYGNDPSEAFRIMGNYTGRILKGEKPGDLPVPQSTKIELVINMKTAKALGLNFPLPLLGRANEVIE
jgi:putative tryptophan/tyrosine transport system substrate-binding protein